MTYQQPLLFVFLALAALGLLRNKGARRSATLVIAIAGLFLCCWPPASWLFSQILTWRYPVRPFEPTANPQAIVVLGESVQPPHFEQPYALAGENTYARCEYAAWIYRRYGPLPVLVSGGSTSPSAPAIGATMSELLRRDGIPENMIWVEDASLSTHENAVYSARVLRDHGVSRIALVVDVISMPRAAACFRNARIDVLPAPCEFREFGPWQDELLPKWRALQLNEETLHEVVGYLWYKLRGWI